MTSNVAAADRPRAMSAALATLLGTAAIVVMYFPLPLLAVFLGLVAVALGAMATLKRGARLGLLGVVLGAYGVGFASPEIYHRVTDTSGPPPGAEDAMKGVEGVEGIGIESLPDMSGMQEETPPGDEKTTKSGSEAEPK